MRAKKDLFWITVSEVFVQGWEALLILNLCVVRQEACDRAEWLLSW